MTKQDQDLLGKSLYNLGNAFSKKGDVKSAIRSYLGAIGSAMEAKNQTLEDEARKNLQLLVHEMKKQKQQQQQQKQKEDQQKQGQQSKEEQNQAQNQNKQDDKTGQGQQQQSQQGSPQQSKNEKDKEDPRYKETTQEERKQQFKSKKLTPEDADRVMSELTNRERDLQEKLQTQHGQSKYNPQDW